ncbi:hypothetical protein [Rubinisphaera margarita]|uniref:hypothetical protein n=1 Tax=Rubinisphaera margarita TaxID=2909586 RepID=UPI001EE7EA0C|nr:hypothetical protein [Rubinisphaera margarita]MCG6154898.1 hypothetical protein [Rubinisphaera margarita]
MQISVESDVGELLTRWGAGRSRIGRERTESLRDAGRNVLSRVIADHPVDTGRSRAGWEAAEQMLGSGGAGQGEGMASAYDEGERSRLEAANFVEYEVFLEYGARGRPGRAMVRRALEGSRLEAARKVLDGVVRAMTSGGGV